MGEDSGKMKKNLLAVVMWFYRGLLSIQWTEHVRKKEVLAKRETKRTLKQKDKKVTF